MVVIGLNGSKMTDYNYLGFLVLRPIGQCVGRNAISPKAKKISDW